MGAGIELHRRFTENHLEIKGDFLMKQCGNSSVGRAQPCQGWGREFESRFTLKISLRKILGFFSFMAGWQSGYAAACKAVYAGSIPASAFTFFLVPVFCPGGGIGRRKGLKIPRWVTDVPVRLRPRAPIKSSLPRFSESSHLPVFITFAGFLRDLEFSCPLMRALKIGRAS